MSAADLQPPAIRIGTPADRTRALLTLVLGFASDPFNRWLFPAADRYLDVMPQLADAFAGRAFEHGSAWLTGDLEGAALWLPPGVEPDHDTLGPLVFGNIGERIQQDLAGVAEEMARYHEQAGACWYLPMIAVDPAHQGRGFGARLLVASLDAIDRQRTAAYLESSNPRNIPLYQRHGFEIMGRIQVGSAPPMHPMLRRARR